MPSVEKSPREFATPNAPAARKATKKARTIFFMGDSPCSMSGHGNGTRDSTSPVGAENYTGRRPLQAGGARRRRRAGRCPRRGGGGGRAAPASRRRPGPGGDPARRGGRR